MGLSMEQGHSARPKEILDRILKSDEVDRDGLRISLWAGFYTGPVFAEIERRHGLLRDENNVLFCLANYGQLTAQSISEFLGRPKNSVSRAVERLLSKGLIRRETDQVDRRKGPLTIEPAGRKLHQETLRLAMAREELMLRSLSPTERVALDHILNKLMDDAENWMCSF
jgi:DNA-binding MarR family transcriptional regulator